MPAHLAQRFESVHAGHEDVDHQEVDTSRCEHRNAGAAIGGDRYLMSVPLEHKPDRRPHRLIAVDHENACHRRPPYHPHAPMHTFLTIWCIYPSSGDDGSWRRFSVTRLTGC